MSKVVDSIREVISGYDYNTRIVEISSRKVNGQFLNTIVSENPNQYVIEDSDDILDKEKAYTELSRLKAYMNPSEELETVQFYALKIQKLQELIDELNRTSDGWDSHVIKIEADDYKMYHKHVNYKNTGGVEYRIGIFVSSKD